jgi:hypothetical protein
MTHLGIPRGAGAAKSQAAAPATLADSSAASSEKPSAPKQFAVEKPAEPVVHSFVSEGDVRRAVTRGEKILIGPKTILTPSARDVAGSDDVLVMTTIVPAKPAAPASE